MNRVDDIIQLDGNFTSWKALFVFFLHVCREEKRQVEDGIKDEAGKVENHVVKVKANHGFALVVGDILRIKRGRPSNKVRPTKDLT